MKYIALSVLLLLVAGSGHAYAAWIEVKEVIKGGDALRTDIVQSYADDGTLGWNYYVYKPGALLETAYEEARDSVGMNGGYSMVPGPERGQMGIGLLGFKDLIDIMHNNGIRIASDIFTAKLKFTVGGPVGEEIIGIYRVLTPWMFNAAGENEGVVNAGVIIPGDEPWNWGDGTQDFNPVAGTDYTTDGGQIVALSPVWGTHYEVDITEIVRGWYTDGNNGLIFKMINDTWPYSDAPYIREADSNISWQTYPDGSDVGPSIVVWVPEPATMALLAIGGIGALLRRKR